MATSSGKKTSAKTGTKKKMSKKKRQQVRNLRIALLLGLIAVAGLVIVSVNTMKKNIAIRNTVLVDGYNVADYDEKSMAETIRANYVWNVQIEGEDISVGLTDPMDGAVERAVRAAYAESAKMQGARKDEVAKMQHSFKVELTSGEIDALIVEAQEKVQEAANNIDSGNPLVTYEASTNSFSFHDGVIGPVVDYEILAAELRDALENRQYEKTVELVYIEKARVVNASDFKMIGSYTTTATANANRNANITIASNTITGMILDEGETFSYNGVLGERNAQKGYKEAGAYSDGEHVLAYGGGICQVSSTMYNAAFAAGIQVTTRTGHTYEPTYVIPGMDATVSYDYPDFAFINNTEGPLGIRVIFENRKVTVEYYGIPILEEGVKRYMESERTEYIEPPALRIEDVPEMEVGAVEVVKNPVFGSKWVTYEVLEKNGEVISREYLHTTKYKGEAGTVRKNPETPAPYFPAPDAIPAETPQETPAE